MLKRIGLLCLIAVNSVLILHNRFVLEDLGNRLFDPQPYISRAVEKRYESQLQLYVDKVYPASVRVQFLFGTGSATIVGRSVRKQGKRTYYLLTAHHLISFSQKETDPGAKRVVHIYRDNPYKELKIDDVITVTVEKDFPNHDAVICSFKSKYELRSAQIAPSSYKYKIGQQIIAAGSPLGTKIKPSFGYITALQYDGNMQNKNWPWMKNRNYFFRTSVHITYGCSGGGIFYNGYLIGITNAMPHQGIMKAPVNWLGIFCKIQPIRLKVLLEDMDHVFEQAK